MAGGGRRVRGNGWCARTQHALSAWHHINLASQQFSEAFLLLLWSPPSSFPLPLPFDIHHKHQHKYSIRTFPLKMERKKTENAKLIFKYSFLAPFSTYIIDHRKAPGGVVFADMLISYQFPHIYSPISVFTLHKINTRWTISPELS